MATNTSKLALTKPDGTDLVDIAVLNANSDKLDTAAGAFICTSTTRPATPWNGQIIFETDTNNVLTYRTSTSAWSIVGGCTVSTTKPPSAGSGNFWLDSDSMKLYVYYTDANSSQWIDISGGTSEVPVAANEAARNTMYPTPQQGSKVFRNDLGVEETYFGLYDVSTNPGGRDTAGWYLTTRSSGLVPVRPTSVVIGTGTGSANAMGEVSFTGATAVSLNNVFTSDYANYYAVLVSDTSANGFIQIRLRNAGTDDSTANYSSGYFTFTTSGTPTTGGGANSANIGTIGNMNTNGFSYGINFFNMRSTTIYKQITAFGMSSLTAVQSMNGFGVNANTFDGFTLIPTTGNITGTVQVFGYND